MSTLKHKGKGPQAMTANELRIGPVVYMTPEFIWSTSYDEALITEDVNVIAKMGEQADAHEEAGLVVGAYFIDVEAESGQPARYREKFRKNGPSFDPGAPTFAEHAQENGPQHFTLDDIKAGA